MRVAVFYFLYLTAIMPSISLSEEVETQSDRQLIYYKEFTEEQKLSMLEDIRNEWLAHFKDEGYTDGEVAEAISYIDQRWENAMKDERLHFAILKDEEVVTAFPELYGLKQPEAKDILGFRIVLGYSYEYDPQIITSEQVKSRTLDCRFPDEEKVATRSLLCRYVSTMSYYTDDPKHSFIIEGDIEQKFAISIAEAWTKRQYISGHKISSAVPKYLSRISYLEGKYSIGYQTKYCGGSVRIKPTVIDNLTHIELTEDASLKCG